MVEIIDLSSSPRTWRLPLAGIRYGEVKRTKASEPSATGYEESCLCATLSEKGWKSTFC
jgi:hypothetical protein